MVSRYHLRETAIYAVEPDAGYAVGVMQGNCIAAVSRIARDPIAFGPVEWIKEGVGDDERELLPQGPVSFTPAMVRGRDTYLERLTISGGAYRNGSARIVAGRHGHEERAIWGMLRRSAMR